MQNQAKILSEKLNTKFPDMAARVKEGKKPKVTEERQAACYALGFAEGLIAATPAGGRISPWVRVNLACGLVDRLFLYEEYVKEVE